MDSSSFMEAAVLADMPVSTTTTTTFTSSSAPAPPPPRPLASTTSLDVTVAVNTPIINHVLSYDLMISVDNFAVVRGSLATMHAEVLRTIKRNDVDDRTKINVISNLMKHYKFDFSLFKKVFRK